MTSSYVAFDPDMLHSPLPFGIQACWQGSVGYAQDVPTILVSFDTLTFCRLYGAPSRCAIRGNHELEKLARLASAPALDKLRQALDAHEKKLTEMRQQHKTGRNALVTAQKKRITFVQDLIASCEQRRHEQKGG
jgi:hypothetical protein